MYKIAFAFRERKERIEYCIIQIDVLTSFNLLVPEVIVTKLPDYVD